MQDFKKLIELIDKAVTDFNQKIPAIQQQMLDRIRIELNSLELKNGNIAISTKNVRKIAEIKSKLQSIMLNADYVQGVKDFIKSFHFITDLQNQYFNTVAGSFTPPEFTKQLSNEAIISVVEKLTEKGLESNVLNGIGDMLRQGITTGGSYSDLLTRLENNLTENQTGEGVVQKYLKQVTVDSINQYSAEYTQLVSNDLGFEWYRYAGSNIETSRPWCLACTKKRWIHISEFPALLSGDFTEFREYDGKLYKGLPSGMYPDTTTDNLTVLRGGYNCGHQFRPVSEDMVPLANRRKVYATEAYQLWAKKMGVNAQGNTPADKFREEKKATQKSVLDDLKGKKVKVPEVGQVGFNRSGIEHAFGNTKNKDFKVKLNVLKDLLSIIKNAKFDRFELDRKGRDNVKGVHILTGSHNGNDIEIILRETKEGGISFYDVRVK